MYLLVGSMLMAAPARAQSNIAFNGSFDQDVDGNGIPDGWTTSGAAGIKQTLTIDDGPQGASAARLQCTHFVTGSAASHAMACQTGHVAVEAKQWYRLTWSAKASDMQKNAVRVALSNTTTWSNAGLSYAFPVGSTWRSYTHIFQAEQALPASNSRLQFWFNGTGTFWLADVKLVPVADQRYEYHPQITTQDVDNFIPNSSFECGTSGWGSFNPDMTTWAGNVFRLLGEIDTETASHGRCSMRVDVTRGEAPVFMWDWFDLVEEEILAPLIAHHGWVRVKRDAIYTMSCSLKTNRPDVPARMLVRDGESNKSEQIVAGTRWQRFSFQFKADSDFVWVGVGPDLKNAPLDSATLWIDAVQLEQGTTVTDYRPRCAVEAFVDTAVTGNSFCDPAQGIDVQMTAFNSTNRDATVRGQLTVTDFFDKPVHVQHVLLPVKAHSSKLIEARGLAKGRTGFFRVAWKPLGKSAPMQTLRCMAIEPYRLNDSVFGMNHAYGWPFLLQLSKSAGLTWWRDWSVKWQDVEPTQNRFDFSGADAQIDRVVSQGLNVDMMFPFPSCQWSTVADMNAIRKVESNRYRHRVMEYACAPNSIEDFQDYIARSVQHYRNRIRHYQVFNEPVYTHYSLPQRLGYTVSDYVKWLNIAAATIRAEQQDAVVVGGMGSWASSSWTHDFVKAGGLANIDILDLHNYPLTADPESYESDIAELTQMMKQRGETRPMWLTEFGCYADDDPYRTPQKVGDAAMSRSVWPSEREAAEALVQSAAVFCTHGMRKIFLHAGSCGPINGSSAGGVFFEYGGTPRKMLPAVWAFSQLMSPNFRPVKTNVKATDRRIYMFKVDRGLLAIAWTRKTEPVHVPLHEDVMALDIMGNSIDGSQVELTATPVYFLTQKLEPENLARALSIGQ